MHPAGDSRIFHKECRELAQAGYEVYLVAHGERGGRQGGVEVMTAPVEKSRVKRMLTSAWHDYRRALEVDADLYHLHDPELVPYALLLRLHGKKVVYDAHEDLPLQILSKQWIPARLRRPLSRVAALILWGASRFVFSAVIAAEPAVEKKFPQAKTVLIQNFPRLDELAADGAAPYEGRPDWIVNIGGISRIRCIREMIQAIELLPPGSVRLILGGRFESDALFDEVSRYPGWSQVDFRGWLDRPGVRQALGEARAGLVLLYPEPTYLEAQPIKLFEYMSAGLPVVASDFPLHQEIVTGSRCGLCVDPQSPKQIAGAIEWLLSHPGEARQMGERGRRAVERKYNWNEEGAKLLRLYERLLAS